MEPDRIHTRETEDTSYRHILRFTGVFGGVHVLKTAASMLRNKLTARLLGPAGLGLITVYNAISGFVVCCCNFGLPVNATRHTGELFESGSQEEMERLVCLIRTWALWTSFFAVVVCLLCSPLLSYMFFDEDFGHYAEILWLAPIVVSLIIAEAECAVLKGLRQLRRVAKLETIAAVAILFLTIPFYYLLGMRGVIVALIVSSIASCLIHLGYSVRVMPYRVKPLSGRVFSEGLPMMRRGIPLALASIANAATGMAVLWVVKKFGNIENTGYYNAVITIMTAYVGMVFTALDSDYFPRLSSVNHDRARVNETINQQVHVSVSVVAPFLMLLLLAMPLVLRILYEPDFLVVRDMALAAAYYVFLRAIFLPMGYTPLAKGHSVFYFSIELLSGVVFGLSMWFFYTRFGLVGAGIALSASAVFDFLVTVVVIGWRYGCRLAADTWRLCAVQFVWVTLMLVCCFCVGGAMRYLLAIPLIGGSLWCAYSHLRKKIG